MVISGGPQLEWNYLPIPENFSGNKFKEIYGDYPISDIQGFIRVDESITSLDNCIDASLITNQRIKVAWEAANEFAESQFDSNSRASLLWLAMQPDCTQERMNKIKLVQSWYQLVWEYYATIKTRINNGEDARFDPTIPGNVPYTIWSISLKGNEI